MARKLYYKVVDDGRNNISDPEWDAILRLQHWYNSEFIWTAGKLAFKMFAVFPNIGESMEESGQLLRKIKHRKRELENEGLSENETINQLEAEGLVIAQKGGYLDKCLASGFTRVASNEFNAYLVSEFLLKVSLLAPKAAICVYDEGEFIKPKHVKFHRGNIAIQLRNASLGTYFRNLISNRHVFAIVDSTKYDNFPRFQTMIADFNDKTIDEKLSILRDWNWLGFDDNFDINGDDIRGFDLNAKVSTFLLEDLTMDS